jgi:hypothetical protein
LELPVRRDTLPGNPSLIPILPFLLHSDDLLDLPGEITPLPPGIRKRRIVKRVFTEQLLVIAQPP